MLTLTSPVDIWAHRLPAGVKLAALAGATLTLFWMTTPAQQALALVAVVALTLSGGMRFAHAGARMLRPLLPFAVLVGLWHLVTGEWSLGAVVVMRMITAVAAANFVTMTTRLSDMLDALTWLCRPLSPVLPPRRLALAVALVIRFVPVMLLRAEAIVLAWQARSPARPGWRVAQPLTLAALDDAARVAEALRARGGSG